MKRCYLKTLLCGVASFSTVASAHHSDQVEGGPVAHIGEMLAAGVVLVAFASLLFLLLRPSR